MEAPTHWLNEERLAVYPRIACGLFVLAGCIMVGVLVHSGDLFHKPTNDFIAFWGTAHLAIAGHAADAYNGAILLRTEQLAFPDYQQICVWSYPPFFSFLLLPFGALRYGIAYLAFFLATSVCYVAIIRRVCKATPVLWCLAGFSGLWVNALCGQNGLLTAAIAGAALTTLPKRPAVAGIFIGLLTIKPHLAVLFPVALIAIGAWTALASAAATAIAMLALSAAAFGTGTMHAWLANMQRSQAMLVGNAFPLSKMPTAFATLRLLGAPVRWAYSVQALFAAVALLAVWHVWRRSDDWQLRSATLMTATFLVSPYLYNYDLAWLAFPILWLALNGVEKGWLPGEREVLTAAWLLPVLMALVIGQISSLQVGPLGLVALLWVSVRRVRVAALAPVAVVAPDFAQAALT